MMTATTPGVTEPTSAFRLGWLPVLLLAALILRLWWLHSFTAVIENEGTEYARIAENLLKGDGYVGKRNEGPQLMFPPLYPFLIAAFSFLVAELDLAGRTVSVLFGTLLVAVIFFIAERIHGRRIAWIAAGLAAFHPWMIGMSAAVYSESTYLTLVMAGVYWALCSLETPSLRWAALSGACFGFAYLTRPEAFIFPFVVVFFVVAINRRALARAARYSGVLVGAFAIVAAPYIAFISSHAGYLRLEGKSPINYQIGQRMLTGMSYIAAGYEVQDDLTPTGVFVRSDLSVVRSNRINPSEMAQYLFASAKGNGMLALRMVTRAPSFGAPLLGALIVIGFFRRSWRRPRALQEVLLLSVVVCVLLAILSVQFFYMRFLYALLPVLIVWGARGIGEMATWTQGTLVGIGWIGHQRRGHGTAVACGLVALLLLVTGQGVGQDSDLTQGGYGQRLIRAAGESLKKTPPGRPGRKKIMDSDGVIAFYAGGTLAAFPYAESSVAIRYIERKGVDVVVLKETVTNRPYLREWVAKGIPDTRAERLLDFHDPVAGRVVIYRWNHGPHRR